MQNQTPDRAEPHLGRQLLRFGFELGIDYLRWTQLVPMLIAWTILLISLAAILLLNFQGIAESILFTLMGLLERFDLLEKLPAEDQEFSISLDEGDLKGFVTKAWIVLAAIGYVLGKLLTLITGPRPMMPLRRQLLIAAMAAGITSLGFFIAYFYGSEEFTDNPAGWYALFIAGPFIVWVVSAYSLGVGHMLQRVKEHILPKITRHILIH